MCVLRDRPDPRTAASLVSNNYFGAAAGAGAFISSDFLLFAMEANNLPANFATWAGRRVHVHVQLVGRSIFT